MNLKLLFRTIRIILNGMLCRQHFVGSFVRIFTICIGLTVSLFAAASFYPLSVCFLSAIRLSTIRIKRPSKLRLLSKLDSDGPLSIGR